MAFLKLSTPPQSVDRDFRYWDWLRQVWQMLNRRVGGKYTPTFISSTNVTSYTISEATWTQIDDVVTVCGSVQTNATAAGATVITLTLPKTGAYAGQGGAASSFNLGTSSTPGTFVGYGVDGNKFKIVYSSAGAANSYFTNYIFSYTLT